MFCSAGLLGAVGGNGVLMDYFPDAELSVVMSFASIIRTGLLIVFLLSEKYSFCQ